MSDWYDITAAAEIVKSGNRVFVQGACATPIQLIGAIFARGESPRDVEFTHLHTYGPVPYTNERWRGHFSVRVLFVGENVRAAADAGRVGLSLRCPFLFAPDGVLPVGVALIQVSPADRHGYCSLGSSLDVTRAAVDHVRHVIALVKTRFRGK